MAKIIYDHHEQHVIVNKPNVIEPCTPGVAAHHEHPGLTHQLHESTPVLCTHLVSVVMVMGMVKTIMMRKRGMMMLMVLMVLMIALWMMTIDRFQRRQITPASRA